MKDSIRGWGGETGTLIYQVINKWVMDAQKLFGTPLSKTQIRNIASTNFQKRLLLSISNMASSERQYLIYDLHANFHRTSVAL